MGFFVEERESAKLARVSAGNYGMVLTTPEYIVAVEYEQTASGYEITGFRIAYTGSDTTEALARRRLYDSERIAQEASKLIGSSSYETRESLLSDVARAMQAGDGDLELMIDNNQPGTASQFSLERGAGNSRYGSYFKSYWENQPERVRKMMSSKKSFEAPREHPSILAFGSLDPNRAYSHISQVQDDSGSGEAGASGGSELPSDRIRERPTLRKNATFSAGYLQMTAKATSDMYQGAGGTKQQKEKNSGSK